MMWMRIWNCKCSNLFINFTVIKKRKTIQKYFNLSNYLLKKSSSDHTDNILCAIQSDNDFLKSILAVTQIKIFVKSGIG